MDSSMTLPLSFFSFTIIFLLLVHYFVRSYSKQNLPPGPKGYPVIGNLAEIGSKPHESLAKLAKQYGPLMTIYQGSVPSIVVSSADMAQQVLQKHDDAFSGRAIPDAFAELEHHAHSMAWLPTGEQWQLARRALATFLTNSQKLEAIREVRQRVMDKMVEHVKDVSKSGGVVDIGKLAFTTAINNMSSTCFSANVDEYIYSSTEDNVKGFKNAVKAIMEVGTKFNIADSFPLLKAMDPQKLRPKANAAYGLLEGLCDNFIDQRLQHRGSNFPRHGDLLDSFIDFQEMEPDFTFKHIQALLVDLFIAGTETTTNTTECAMSELILHPEIMTKLRSEISETVKTKGRLDEAEILKLPYLQAVVKETMRLHLAVPFLLPHKTQRDVNLNNYTIPKDTQVLVNSWTIARDAIFWDNPTSFMPERFVDSELDFKGHHFSFLPFGSGRRMCPGMPVAHRVVSLMIASLVHHFEWKLPNGMAPEKLDMNQNFGLTLQRAVPLTAIPVALETNFV